MAQRSKPGQNLAGRLLRNERERESFEWAELERKLPSNGRPVLAPLSPPIAERRAYKRGEKLYNFRPKYIRPRRRAGNFGPICSPRRLTLSCTATCGSNHFVFTARASGAGPPFLIYG